jgi:hypothetical protein
MSRDLSWKRRGHVFSINADICFGLLGVPGGTVARPEQSLGQGPVVKSTYTRICDRLWENPAKVFYSDVNVYVFYYNLYHVQNILLKGISQYLKYFVSYYILKCSFWKTSKILFEKRNYIGVLLILLTLGAVLRHFWKYFCTLEWIKCIKRGIFTKK